MVYIVQQYWYGWRNQIRVLAEAGYRVLAPDQRGYNLSEKPPGYGAYRLDALVRDVLGLINTAGRENAILVGHDWGAAVAWQVTAEHPKRIEKLAIMNVPHPAVMVRTLRSSPAQLLKSWYIFFFQLPRLPEWSLRRRNFAAMRKIILRSSKPGAFPRGPGALCRGVGPAGRLDRHAELVPGSIPPGAALVGKKISETPGWQDRRAHLDAMGYARYRPEPPDGLSKHQQCEQGRLVYFKDAAHWVQHDEPEHVNALLLDFLENGLLWKKRDARCW
ncbi:MAG TPA: alpha/beta hydrolase [Anaerolineales bacterium]|nr:alpha/beta hydrolase [Anaerolineales bacterium]